MSVRSGQVSGRTVQVAIEGVMSVFRRRIRNTLNDNGISEPDPQPDAWYEMEDFLCVLDEVREDAGESALTKIGEATPKHVEWQGDPADPGEALDGLTDVYRSHHRSASGRYEVERVEPSTARVTSDTPYPCQFDLGLLKGTVKEHGGDYARIEHVEDCREDGCDSCTYEVRW